MASRPIFVPKTAPEAGVDEVTINFEWFPGIAKIQKQKSVQSLHDAAAEQKISPILEISSKSKDELGIKLSAFNLMITTQRKGEKFSVETAFQSSKKFENGGPFTDLLNKTSRDAKKDKRLKESGRLVAFLFFGKEFPLQPETFFYDWVYVNALDQNKHLSDELMEMKYHGFTDIEFNPKKSFSCQARSAALYVSLRHADKLRDALESPENFKEIYRDHDTQPEAQDALPLEGPTDEKEALPLETKVKTAKDQASMKTPSHSLATKADIASVKADLLNLRRMMIGALIGLVVIALILILL